jgi:hypothetical protein
VRLTSLLLEALPFSGFGLRGLIVGALCGLGRLLAVSKARAMGAISLAFSTLLFSLRDTHLPLQLCEESPACHLLTSDSRGGRRMISA